MTDALRMSPVPAYHDALVADGWQEKIGGYFRTGRVCSVHSGPVRASCDIRTDVLDLVVDPVSYADREFAAAVVAAEGPRWL
ncbi:hypothetical protein CVO77_00290 [Sphingopyxis lindanitolerans]|uniref:Uncharacterized protein n=1 Tax=Sphingopyxis lindanitolerans TaxID=2054227 RepID=A0A2S8BAG5_9SPHN|nr:hypothetical protein [Sphingopyxis lindanitolerans]PQM29412.1 hypothetical protein CVO77_00290 [Sphingopyxis lindanitolerans]